MLRAIPLPRHRQLRANFAYDLCVRRIKRSDLSGVDLSAGAWPAAGQSDPCADAYRLRERFRAFGFREMSFLPGYGLANTSWPRRSRRAGGYSHGRPARQLRRRPAGSRLRIVDEHGGELPEREVGEITLG